MDLQELFYCSNLTFTPTSRDDLLTEGEEISERPVAVEGEVLNVCEEEPDGNIETLVIEDILNPGSFAKGDWSVIEGVTFGLAEYENLQGETVLDSHILALNIR